MLLQLGIIVSFTLLAGDGDISMADFHLGLERPDTSTHDWFFQSDPINIDTVYTNWFVPYASQGNTEGCAKINMRYNGQWSHVDCTANKKFICKVEL